MTNEAQRYAIHSLKNSITIMNTETQPTPETNAQSYDCEYFGDMVSADFARKLERQRDEALEALREAWLAMDELVDVPDRIINWQNKYAYILEETK